MKKNETIIIAVLIIITIILGIVLIVRNTSKPKEPTVPQSNTQVSNQIGEEFVQDVNGNKVNISTKLKEKKKLDNLEIGNIQLSNQNGQTVLIADVTNTGTTTSEILLIDVTLVDKNGTTIVTIPGIVSPIPAGGTSQLSLGASADYANAYDFRVTKK